MGKQFTMRRSPTQKKEICVFVRVKEQANLPKGFGVHCKNITILNISAEGFGTTMYKKITQKHVDSGAVHFFVPYYGAHHVTKERYDRYHELRQGMLSDEEIRRKLRDEFGPTPHELQVEALVERAKKQ